MINRVKLRHRYRSIFFMYRHRAAGHPPGKWNTVFLPKKISLEGENRALLLQAITELNNFAIEGSKKILLDFKSTVSISATGMIVLYAELKNILNYDSEIKIRCLNVSTNRIRQVLKQIGLFSICNHTSRVKITRDDVVNWRVCSGTNLIGEKFDQVVLPDTILEKLPEDSELYAGCVEATMNVVRHAYFENTRTLPVMKEKEAWWCFTQVKDGMLQAVVCDLGLSIPYTLPKRKEKLHRWLRLFIHSGEKMKDADFIAGAISSPTSRSGESFRGNGLPKIAECARTNGGSLAIHSRHGFVQYEGMDGPVKKNYRVPVNGTVIAWALPIGEK